MKGAEESASEIRGFSLIDLITQIDSVVVERVIF
jgi:hypothetical protein